MTFALSATISNVSQCEIRDINNVSMKDLELESRGRLIRSLLGLREMLPGSFVERRRKCGKPNCRCASGDPDQLHAEFLLSFLFQGKPRTFHIPAELVEEVRSRVQLHKRFQQAETAICDINLRRLLQGQQKRGDKAKPPGA